MRYGIGETSKEFGYRSAFYDAIPCYACSAFFLFFPHSLSHLSYPQDVTPSIGLSQTFV